MKGLRNWISRGVKRVKLLKLWISWQRTYVSSILVNEPSWIEIGRKRYEITKKIRKRTKKEKKNLEILDIVWNFICRRIHGRSNPPYQNSEIQKRKRHAHELTVCRYVHGRMKEHMWGVWQAHSELFSLRSISI